MAAESPEESGAPHSAAVSMLPAVLRRGTRTIVFARTAREAEDILAGLPPGVCGPISFEEGVFTASHEEDS